MLLECRRRWREDGEKDGGEVGGDGGEGGEGGRPRREARLVGYFWLAVFQFLKEEEGNK